LHEADQIDPSTIGGKWRAEVWRINDRDCDMKRITQQQTITLDRGLFLVRYVAAEDQARPPRVKVSADPTAGKNIQFLLHPDHSVPVLWQPDTCLVIHAKESAQLAVRVIPAREGGSIAATVRIEPLSQGNVELAPTHSNSNDTGTFQILGHLTGIGDVIVNADDWLAGPSAPTRIEGISLAWPGRPPGLDIRYAVKTAKPQPISGRATELGSFAGTRGKAMPIVGLMFEICGPAAANFQISVEAIFLGSAVTHIIGDRIVASGPTGREPLVGLRLGLNPTLGLKGAHHAARPTAKAFIGKARQSADRAHVYRSRPKSNQPVTV
jgi:hypothetical protein